MTNERYQSHRPARIPDADQNDKEQAPSTVVLPIAPGKNITLQRVKYVNDARGCIWRGIVAETGESALLMRWTDGHITGLVGYKGRIYTVASLGGQLHAMVEMDPAPAAAGSRRLQADRRSARRPAPGCARPRRRPRRPRRS